MSVVQGGLAAIVGLVGVVVGQTLKLDVAVSLLVGIVLAVVGFVAAGALIPAGPAPVSTARTSGGGKKEKSEKKPKKEKEPKAKKQAAAVAPQPEEEEEEEEEEQPKPVEKAKKKKKSAKDEPATAPTPAPAPAAAGKKGKAATPAPAAVPVPVKVESESEEEEEVAAPKSKSALKKAKAKAAALKKEAEEKAAALAAAAAAAAAEAAAKLAAAAEGGKKKKKKAAAEEAPAPKQTKPTKEEKANLEEGEWELPSHTKRSKKQEEAKAAKAASNKANSAAAAAVTTDEKSNQSYAEIKVDVKQLGVLIGTGGATLKLIQEETKTKIEVPKKDSGSSIVKITGADPESVSRAQGTIESLLTRGFSSITHPGEIQDDIFIATEQIGAVVGTGGNILKLLQNATKTVIKIPQKSAETSRPGGEKGVRATITGAKDNVKAAKAAIKSLIADGFSPLTNPGWEKVELAFPKEKIPLLIGLKGHTIKSIQGNTRTRINISPEKVVSVVGTEDGIRQAVKEINRLLEPVGGYAPEDEDWVQDEVEAQGTWGFKSTAVQGEEALWD